MSVISLEEARKKLEKALDSASQSGPMQPSGQLGQIPTDPGSDGSAEEGLMKMYQVCREAWHKGFKCKSKFARDNAEVVAICATEGLITTEIVLGVWGNTWMINDQGAAFMSEIEHDFS